MKLKQILNILFCIIIVISMMVGCDNPEENLAGTVGNLKAMGTAVTSYEGCLGYGYNLIDQGYFTAAGINDNRAVLDTDKLVQGRHIYSSSSDGTITDSYITGTDTSDYEEDLSASFNISVNGLFSGSFSNSFTYDKNQKYSSTDSFVTTYVTKTVKDEYINLSDINELKKYMTKQFRKDINNKDIAPEEILTNYGTHVILNTLLGGRMELNYKYHNYYQYSKETLEDQAKAAYADVKTSVSGKFSEETQELINNSELKVNLYGGNGVDLNTLNDVSSSYSKWFKSIDENKNLAFIGVNNLTVSKSNNTGDNINRNSLLPIWELADDQERQSKIEECYKTMMKNSGSCIADIQPTEYIKGIYFGNGNNSDKAKSNLKTDMQSADPNANSMILNYDLNNHAGGDFIYMGCILTTNKDEAVSDIMLDYNKSESKLTKTKNYKGIIYNKINLDLTKGTGGDYYIHLYYTKDKAVGEPLKAAGIEYDNNNYTFAQDNNLNGWTPVGTFNGTDKLDVNKGAGGKYIYLWKKR